MKPGGRGWEVELKAPASKPTPVATTTTDKQQKKADNCMSVI
jgi:hypothetical protein